MNRRLSAFIPFIFAALGCSNSISDSGGAGAGGAAAGSPGSTGGSAPMGGSAPVAGSDAGGSPSSTAGSSPGGASMGGAATAGAGGSSGGTTMGGAGGSGTAGSATGGGAGGGGGGAPAAITISGTTAGPFDNSFMITACKDSGNGYDCLNAPASGMCDSNTKWSYMSGAATVMTGEANGFSTSDAFTVSGGDPSKIYDVTVHVVGQVEGRTYVSGMAHSTSIDPGKEKNDMLYVGGQPGPNRQDYNVFQMTITGGTAIPGAPTYYAFNSTLVSLEGQHHNYSIDETFTFKVKTGMTITFTNHDSNCRSIMNCGTSAAVYNYSSGADCAAHARATPADVTLPATFHGVTIMSPDKFQTQFVNVKVTSIVAE
jgi:hypothetical protein